MNSNATKRNPVTITVRPSVGLPDRQKAVRLMVPVILSLWELNGQRRPPRICAARKTATTSAPPPKSGI
jgi:hypothetical protein